MYFLTYNLRLLYSAYVSMYCLGVRYSSEYVDRSSLKNFIRPILVYHFKLITEFAERKQATPAQIALAWEINPKVVS